MTDLLTRLESGSGSDRELDALIMCKLAAPEGAYVKQSHLNGNWCIYHGEWNGQPRLWEGRAWRQPSHWEVTSSLDAALSLVERMLPGHDCTIAKAAGGFDVDVYPREWPADFVSGRSATAPRALLIALLRALDQEPQT